MIEFPPLPERASIGPENTQPYNDPLLPGQGHHIFVTDEVVYIMWYTWDTKESVQRFYWGEGKEDGKVTIEEALTGFDVWTTKGGSFTDPTTRIPINVGRARLYFMPDGKGLFQFNMHEFRRGSVILEPFEATPIQSTLNRGWFDPTRNGEGITFYEYPNGKCYGGLFAYRNTDPTPYHFRSAKIRMQRWLIFEGKLQPTGEYACILYKFIGGKFLRFDDVSKGEDVGQLDLYIESDGINAAYSFDAGDGTAGTGAWNMKPLF